MTTSLALSIMQPWAHAILRHGKNVENRSWPNRSPWREWRDYRGPLYLHASAGVGSFDDFDSAVRDVLEVACGFGTFGDLVAAQRTDAARRAMADEYTFVSKARAGERQFRPAAILPRGGIVGRARVAGVVDDLRCSGKWRARIGPPVHAETRDLTSLEQAWWTGGFALVLADVEPLPFVSCKGALGLWPVPENVLDQIEGRRG